MSARSKARVYVVTILGTLLCIAVAFAIDSYSVEDDSWQIGGINNLVIPLILAPPILYYLLSKQRELAIAHEELMKLASTDPLTSCLNRRAFTAMVEGYLERVQRQKPGSEGALLVIDVDHFKAINDSFGHDCGDEALKLIAQTIQDAVRNMDLVGRVGGEEFGVFLPGVEPDLSETVAERIRTAVNAARFAPDGRPYDLSVSIGGTTLDQGADFNALYRLADALLYEAKRNGRNRVEMRRFPAPVPDRRIAVH